MYRIRIGFIVSILISGIAFTVYTYVPDQSFIQNLYSLAILLLVGIGFSFIVVTLIALPAFLVLRFLGMVNIWSVLISGLIVGSITASITEWPQNGLAAFTHFDWTDHAVRRACYFAMIGISAALSFWLIGIRTTKSNAD